MALLTRRHSVTESAPHDRARVTGTDETGTFLLVDDPELGSALVAARVPTVATEGKQR